MKDSIITIRVSDEQKLRLEEYSYEQNIPISRIIREIIDKELSEPEEIYLGEGRYYSEATDKPMLLNHNFTSLIFWIYDKYLNPYADEKDEFYFDLISIINQINESRLFTKEFLDELSKVKKELEKHLEDYFFYKFTFPHGEGGFDYEILRKAFHSIKLNSDNEEVINLK